MNHISNLTSFLTSTFRPSLESNIRHFIFGEKMPRYSSKFQNPILLVKTFLLHDSPSRFSNKNFAWNFIHLNLVKPIILFFSLILVESKTLFRYFSSRKNKIKKKKKNKTNPSIIFLISHTNFIKIARNNKLLARVIQQRGNVKISWCA